MYRADSSDQEDWDNARWYRVLRTWAKCTRTIWNVYMSGRRIQSRLPLRVTSDGGYTVGVAAWDGTWYAYVQCAVQNSVAVSASALESRTPSA